MSDDVMVQAGDRWMFRCPGCGFAHQIDSRWAFNGDARKPTICGSILVYAVTHARRVVDTVETFGRPRCHSFVIDGRIQFLSDSTHDLAGQTVDLPPWESAP